MGLGRTIALAAVALLWAAACAGDGPRQLPRSGTISIALVTVTPTPAVTPTPTATPTPTPPPDVCLANPDQASEAEIQVQEPSTPPPEAAALPLGESPAPELGVGAGQPARPGVQVRSPLHVRGWGSDIARDELGISVALVDEQGQLMPIRDARGQEVQVVNGPPQPLEGRIPPPGLTVTDATAPFAVDIAFQVQGPKPVCLWVFIQPVGSSDPRDVVQIPLELLP